MGGRLQAHCSLIPRAEIRLQKQRRLIVKNNEVAIAGNFGCKDNDVRRERPQITMNINAENK
jgi:hypothetical protein